jgi:hypothetical protein
MMDEHVFSVAMPREQMVVDYGKANTLLSSQRKKLEEGRLPSTPTDAEVAVKRPFSG